MSEVLTSGAVLSRESAAKDITEFDRKVAASLNNPTVHMLLLESFKGYLTQLLWLANPPASAAALFGKLPANVYSAWSAYTPTWTASVNPAIGDGTLAGRYVQLGDTVIGYASITMGSTTTYGSGVWVVGIPVAAHASAALSFFVHLGDADAGERTGLGRRNDASSVALFSNNGSAVMGIVSATTPQTWAAGDTVLMPFAYEAA